MQKKKRSVISKKTKERLKKEVAIKKRIMSVHRQERISVVMDKPGQRAAMEELRAIAAVFCGGSVAELVRRIVMDVVSNGKFEKPGYIDSLFPRNLDAFKVGMKVELVDAGGDFGGDGPGF